MRLRAPARWPATVGAVALGLFVFAACSTGATAAPEASDADTAENPVAATVEKPETNGRDLDPAPEFVLALHGNENHEKGEPLKLSDLKGKPVVVNFWFPSCPPCRLEMPDLEAAFQVHKGDVEFIGVQQLGLDSIEDGQDFVDDFGLTFAVGPDETGDVIRDYKLIAFPSTYFLDKDHNIVNKWSGALNAEKIEELIQDILP